MGNQAQNVPKMENVLTFCTGRLLYPDYLLFLFYIVVESPIFSWALGPLKYFPVRSDHVIKFWPNPCQGKVLLLSFFFWNVKMTIWAQAWAMRWKPQVKDAEHKDRRSLGSRWLWSCHTSPDCLSLDFAWEQ